MDVAIELAKAPTAEIVGLLDELNKALAGYADDQRHALSIDKLFEPGVLFFVARLGGEAVGCGGVAFIDDYAEVKRMYSKLTVRGKGIARALLSRIEAEALAAGLSVLRLETGLYQKDALRFYEDMGFRRRTPFGTYLALPPHAIETSLFYEKAL